MMARCYNQNEKAYKNYGGRGITVCKRWHKFENFYADMGDPPFAKATLERVDNEKGYHPGNVVWATNHAQQRNKRTNVKITWKGRTLILKDWATEFRVCYKSLARRVSDYGADFVFEQIEKGVYRYPRSYYKNRKENN